MQDALWFLPLDASDGSLRNVYEPQDAQEIAPAAQFSVRLEAVKLARTPKEPVWQRFLHSSTDVLVLSSSALGAKPLVERVHYYRQNFNPESGLFLRDILSDVVCVCDDYKEPDSLYVELNVVTIDTSDEHKAAVIQAFETLAGTAGAIFPVVLPYAGAGDAVLKSLASLWHLAERRETWRITEPIKLFSARTPQAKTLRLGRYIVFSQPVDGTKYQLGVGAELQGPGADDLSYAVLRIEPASEIAVDYVVSQRVATLLTQLKNDQAGQPGGLQTSFGFLTDTLRTWTNFTDLQRYYELSSKSNRSSLEENLMHSLAQRADLQPFLPKPPAPDAT